MSLAVISHKYNLPSFEKWSLDIIYRHCHARNPYFDNCSASQTERLLDVSFHGDHTELRGLIEECWIYHFEARHQGFLIGHALDVAEKYGLREFLGSLYYHEVSRSLGYIAPLPDSTAVSFAPDDLGPNHVLRLLTGFHSLSLYWQRTVSDAPPLEMNIACNAGAHHHFCLPTWRAFWYSVTTQHPFSPLFALENLAYIEARCNNTVFHRPITCASMASQAVQNVIVKLRRTLSDHFLGPHPYKGKPL